MGRDNASQTFGSFKVEAPSRMRTNNNKNAKANTESSSKTNRKNTDVPTSSGSKKTTNLKGRLRKGKHDDDDESVDSKGNIRGLISYSEEEEEDEVEDDTTSTEEVISPKKKPPTRAAAIKARKAIRKKYAAVDEDEDDDSDFVKEEKGNKKQLGFTNKKKPAPKVIPDEEESEEDEEEDEVSDEEEDEVTEDEEEEEDESNESDFDSEEDEEEEDYRNKKAGGISISFGSFDDTADMIPKKHNMKKEPEIVKKFVKLLQNPFKENTIDDQIDLFKGMTEEKQKQMILALDRKNSPSTSEQPLMFRILSMNVPPETQTMIINKYNSLQTLDPSTGEYFKVRSWLEKLTSVPLGIYKEMPVRLEHGTEKCTAFMERARRCMEEAIYGQEEAKMQILQFIASKIANPTARGLSLLLVGPPGIGKTSLIKNGIAKALDWPFQFISLGGDSDATTYTGHQLVYESSHCGKIVNSLVTAKSMSMVLLFDELDKISGTPKGEEVQNMLVHLTDPVQNADFEDKYLSGIPIDLSKAMFVFSGNDINKIDRILLDRMIVVKLNGYTAKEKQAIAEQYILPSALQDVNLNEKVGISPEVLTHIIKEYSGEETGVRELKRCVETVIQKINMLRIFNSKDLPFHIKDFSLPFVVKKEHVDLFLKKKEPAMDVSVQRMYC